MPAQKGMMMQLRCPVCKQETTWEENPTRPFCSERCRTADLGKWASGEYRIAGEKPPESDEESGEPSERPPKK